MTGIDTIRASYYTLGCKLNFAETSTIGRILADRGIVRAQAGETPQLCVINTCSVTEMADKKGRSLIRRIASKYPDATLIVTGCYAQLKPEEAASIPGVDIVLGTDEKLKISAYIDQWLATHEKRVAVSRLKEISEFRHSCEHGDRTRYFLKVQDGCDYFCTYCTIPYARGRSRSPRIDELVEEARCVAAEGGKEIVLTGVNIGDFGKGTDSNFFDLIRELDKVEGIERYRISSIEPNLLTPEIIRWVARESRAFMPHFHIPLQAGSNEVLRMMNRRYDTALFASRIDLIRKEMPDAFVGVDVIAGARGETEELWRQSFDFIKSLDLTRLHVFPYSERPGTAALHLGGSVDKRERHLRVGRLTRLSERMLSAFMKAHEGKIYPVLWEQPQKGCEEMHGFTPNYIKVVSPLRRELINTVTSTRLDSIAGDDEAAMKGTVII